MKALRLFIILPCLLLLGSVSGFAEMTSDEALSEFVAAGMAYKEGRYDAAIERYTSILKGDRVNGPLYYNLGNSYFKRKNVGQAILNYERAKKFIPRDSDLNFNEHYVRSKIDQQIDVKQSFLDRAIVSHIQFYTIGEMAIILYCIGLMIGMIHLISLYVQWSQTVTSGVIAALMFSLFVYGTGLVAKVQAERELAVVMTDSNTLFEPRTDSTMHFKLSEGMKARILKRQGNWIKIERLDGKVGWIDREVLEKI